MLTARNFVAITIGIAVVSLAWACYELARPPDSGGSGRDSYGTRALGQRGLFEILADLGIPVQRILAPPTVVVGREVTLVLWDPQPDLVQMEPAYLHAVAKWVEGGGRVVVAPGARRAASQSRGLFGREKPARDSTVLGELGLAKVSVTTIDLDPVKKGPKADSTARPSNRRAPENATNRDEPEDDDVRRLRELLTGIAPPIATRAVKVTATGVLSPLSELVATIEVPAENLQVLNVGESAPDGTVTFRDPAGSERMLVAVYRRGRGELVVVASPTIAENRLIARQDNSVLAVQLLAVPARPVVFDEFYHGLTIRGNALWLFTQHGYAATTLALLALIGLWIWREAVFLGPPLAAPAQSRRSIGEYVDAMARLLNRGGSSQAFLLREVRSGVMQSVRDELHLPPSRDHVDELAAVLARRDPRRARQLVDAIGAVDEALSRKRVLKESVAVDLFKRMSRCL
ncbi:MAG: DUF4350 domain-containing protein [Isosphaeraceae bacterium]